MDTKFELILQNLETRLGEITTANGYNTGIGENVYRGISMISSSKLPLTTIDAPTESVTDFYGQYQIEREVNIGGIVAMGTANPSKLSEKILGDIREAVEGDRVALVFESGTSEVSVGDTVTGAASGASGFVQSITLSGGTWAGGDAEGTITLRRVNDSVPFQTGESFTSGDVVSAIHTDMVTGVTGGYAEKIQYVSGGTEEFPEEGTNAVYVAAQYTFTYRTKVGNPYE